MGILVKMVGGLAVSMLVAAPVLAAPVRASQSAPISKASVSSLPSGARAGKAVKAESDELGTLAIAGIALAVGVATVVVVADDDDGSN